MKAQAKDLLCRLIFERVNVCEEYEKDFEVIQIEVFFSADLGDSSNYSNKKFEDRSRERFQANVVRT
jgi:hypothetical protein